MDRNEVLELVDRIGRFLRLRKTGDEVDIWCEQIYDSGIGPDWVGHELAHSYYQCRLVHLKKGERVAGE
jgi:hypothetical protein